MPMIFDDKTAITVAMDPGYILTCMQLWRDAVDMKIPVRDEFKVHFMTNRRSLLEGYDKTATAWGMLLGSMKAVGQDLERLAEVHSEVEAFKAWAKAGLDALEQVAIKEEMDDVLQDGLQQLAADPAGRAMLKRMIDQGIFQPPSGGKKKGKG